MKKSFQLRHVGFSRIAQACAIAAAVVMLPVEVADAKPKKKNPAVAKAAAERNKAQQQMTQKVEAWNDKLKAAVKDGIITEQEARTKLAAFRKKLMEARRAEFKKMAAKRAADRKAAAKKRAEASRPKKKPAPKKALPKKKPAKKPAAKKQPAKENVKKQTPEPVSVRDYVKKLRAEVKAGKLTKKEAKQKIAAYKKKMTPSPKKHKKHAKKKGAKGAKGGCKKKKK